MLSFLAMVQTDPANSLIGPFMNLGAIGASFVALGIWYIKKDRKYEQRIDERIAAETQFRKDQAEQQEKYRLAMEKVGQTLDSLYHLLLKKRGGDP